MPRFDAVGLWLRDDLLPGLVIVLGGVLLIRCIRCTESRYQQRLDSLGFGAQHASLVLGPSVVISVPLPCHIELLAAAIVIWRRSGP